MIEVKITNANGIHARPASTITNIASNYMGNVYLEKNGILCNAKNVISIMELNLICGDVVKVTACGRNSNKIENLIKEVIENIREIQE